MLALLLLFGGVVGLREYNRRRVQNVYDPRLVSEAAKQKAGIRLSAIPPPLGSATMQGSAHQETASAANPNTAPVPVLSPPQNLSVAYFGTNEPDLSAKEAEERAANEARKDEGLYRRREA